MQMLHPSSLHKTKLEGNKEAKNGIAKHCFRTLLGISSNRGILPFCRFSYGVANHCP